MVWRGTTSSTDRVFSCLVYLLPLLDVIGLVGRQLLFFESFLSPVLQAILVPLAPLISLYYGFGGFMPLIIFFALFILVVRNEAIAHFIRFNAMQAILIGILLSLFGILWSYVFSNLFPPASLVTQTLFNTVFLATLAAVGYSMVQSALGRYAEIPTLSDAAYTQVR